MEQNQLFDAVKLALKKTRVTSLDGEIERLVAAAKADLATAGVCKIEDDDENIKQACVLYAKANFGETETPERYAACFEALRDRLALNSDYNGGGNNG